jgi:hypothetical protein
MTIKIQVTEEDIKNGKQRDSTCCPVALACKRAVNKNWAEVFYKLESNNPNGGMGVFEEFPVLGRFITSFDQYRSVTPFEVDLPDYIQY